MKFSKPQRIATWIVVVLLVLVGLYVVLGRVVEHQVRRGLEDAALKACAQVDTVHPPEVDVNLYTRSVRVTGLILEPLAVCSERPITVRGRLDTLQVSGVSLIGLLLNSAFVVNEASLHVSDTWVTLRNDTACVKPSDAALMKAEPWTIDLGHYRIQLRSITVVTPAGDTTSVPDQGLLAEGRDLHFQTGPEMMASIRSEQLRVEVDSIDTRMAHGYNWSVGRIRLDQQQGTLDVFSARLDPKEDLEKLSDSLEFETDVFQMKLDTIRLVGVDVGRSLAEGMVSVRKLDLRSGDITVLRDKTLPDGPSVTMPLLARLIRKLPVESGVDTIAVADLAARYRERGDRARGFALIPFSHINALITGARHGTSDTSALVIRAHCEAFDSTPVALQLRSVVLDTTDRFVLNASIGYMPFTALNQATGPLVDIRSTEGRIDSVILHMDADDRHASGSVYMNYHGLKMVSGGKKRKETMNRLETILLNTLVQDDYMDSKGAPREGRFSFPRRQDRAVFNYMWSGLREGTKAVLLPEMLTQ